MKKTAIILLLCWVSICVTAQIAPQKYFIEFMDKTNSPYSISRPNEFLSLRAIERRQKQGVAIGQDDIPVNQTYVERVRSYGVNVLTRSKWFNGITIYCLNPTIVDTILRLPFVKRIIKDKSINSIYSSNSGDKFSLNEASLNDNHIPGFTGKSNYSGNPAYDYGPSYNQIHMLKGDSLHKLGYKGEGMIIAILDAGFYRADILAAFDSLRHNNQILGTRDFVTPGNNVYNEYEHGMEVLSCMGGNIPGQIVGTAPKAGYWLLRSEDKNSEYLIEEYNWVAAAEFADSAGADVINSSLGYTEFNEVTQNHTCQEMNGNTTLVTRGANIASGKGMLVVNSAGNSGASAWQCISAPADGFNVLAVAAVDSNGIRAGFSSIGESTRRIKPNVAAMGKGAVVYSPAGTVIYNNGTSFSSPIMAGLAACLWQALPSWNNQAILRAIELSGNQVSHPDSLLGYGIPDFIKAFQHVNVDNIDNESAVHIYPNPFNEAFSLSFHSDLARQFDLYMLNSLCQVVYSAHNQKARIGDNLVTFPNMAALPNGNYIIRLTGNSIFVNSKVIKLSK